MASRDIKFPCPVRRISLTYRRGTWSIENETRVESMTLPKSDELPKPTKKRGVSGSWYEAVDKQGRTIYRQTVEDFGAGMEVFERDGKIRRIKDSHDEFGLEILVPDVPDLEEIHIYSSTKPSEDEREMIEEGTAQRIATINLRGGTGGGYGRK